VTRVRIDPSRKGALLSVRVQPRARREGIVGIHDGALKIALRAPPLEGAANTALLKRLAKTFEVPMKSLSITSGASGRKKRILFGGVSVEELRRWVDALVSEGD